MREDILLTLFSNPSNYNIEILPARQDLERYGRIQESLKAAFKVIGIDESRSMNAIDPFFDVIFDLISKLTQNNVKNRIGRDSEKELNRTFHEWIALNPRLALIVHIETLVKLFSAEEKKIFQKIERYLDIMNSFLMDSKKRLSFKDDSSLTVEMEASKSVDVSSLSSGERQLFVLITTLIFNDDEKRGNVVIIDEPELSLHIKWQEMFVEALLSANPKIQLLLATHSPSIILDREGSCVDLT